MVGQNWRSRPLGDPLILRGILAGRCHRLPRRGSFPSATTIRRPGGERYRPVMQNKKSGADRTNQPQSRVTPPYSGVSESGANTVGKEPMSYYCEPVWRLKIRRFWTNKICRQSVLVSQPEGEKGSNHRELSGPSGRRRENGDDHGRGNKIRTAEGSEQGVGRMRTKRNLKG
jgi:hypothetical protein